MERPFERLVIVGPVVLIATAIWAMVSIALDRGLAAAANGLLAFLLPVMWGAVGFSLYSQFGSRLRSLNEFIKIIVPMGMGVLLGLLMFSGEGPTAVLLFGVGAILGVFILLQSPNLRPSQIRTLVLDAISPGLLVVYASVVSGLALTSLFEMGA